MIQRLRKLIPSEEQLRHNRLLRPLLPWLQERALWRFDRRAVALGVAVGLFFGLLLPIGQILFAAFAAFALRANLPIAALSTLVTNPVTFPPIYYAAYRLGNAITGGSASENIEAGVAALEPLQSTGAWLSDLLGWLASVGPPLATGVITLAIAASLMGYVLVHALWRLSVVLRSRARRARGKTRT